jgi:AraC family transcriptional regulator
MGGSPGTDFLRSSMSAPPKSVTDGRLIVPCVGLVRDGCVEPFLKVRPTLSSAHARWSGVALERYSTPAISIDRHQHPELFLHLVVGGTAKCEVNTGGRILRSVSRPETIFLLPQGTEDAVHWAGPIDHLVVSLHPRRLAQTLEETSHQTEIELTEHWDLVDEHISVLLNEMAADLNDGSPAGAIYGDTLATALSVYLLKRYAVQRRIPAIYKGGLPAYRLRRVLDYIANCLDTDISLSQLAAIADMSPHYFSELFKQSTGKTPHTYVLTQRIERAKQTLLDPQRSILDAGLEAGFQNHSHFSRMFRRIEGTSPSRFRADNTVTRPRFQPAERAVHTCQTEIPERPTHSSGWGFECKRMVSTVVGVK